MGLARYIYRERGVWEIKCGGLPKSELERQCPPSEISLTCSTSALGLWMAEAGSLDPGLGKILPICDLASQSSTPAEK